MMSTRASGRRTSPKLAAIWCAVSLSAITVVAIGIRGQGGADPSPYRPSIELRGAGVFPPAAASATRAVDVTYRLDAQLLLPLLVTSVTLGSWRDVGLATVSYREIASLAGDLARAYEFFAISVPARAHGVDRMGFFREIDGATTTPHAWSAYFGAVSASPEKTLEEGRRTVADKRPNDGYEIIDGLVTRAESRSLIFRVGAAARPVGASEMYSMLRPLLRRENAAASRVVPLTSVAQFTPMSFLGALEQTFQAAAGSESAPGRRSLPKQTFVYHGKVRSVELVESSPDAKRARTLAALGWVKRQDQLRRMRYRILEGSDEESEFKVWVELPDHLGAHFEPIVPVAFEFEPRSFLRLAFERSR